MMSGIVQELVLRHKPMTSEQEVRRTKTSGEDVFKVLFKTALGRILSYPLTLIEFPTKSNRVTHYL